jgi:putative integral membrane protein (TIGR02587 family)
MSGGRADLGPWAAEGLDLVRAVAGGLLFGIPLLFTMEVWWIGTATRPGPMVAALLLTLLVVVVLTRTSGFRSTKDIRLVDAVMDGIEAVALGVLSVFVLLVLLQEITPETPLREALGKTVYEATPFGMGIALAQQFLRKGRDGKDDGEGAQDGGDGSAAEGRVGATVADLGATVTGAVFVAFNIAPTDEVPVLAAAMGAAGLIAVVVVSLLVSFVVVFVAGFSNEEKRHRQPGILQHPVTETVVCYLVALVCSAAMLLFFQRLDMGAPLGATLRDVIVLGLPASVGGAAGRLVV